jgi:hypothetical protein
MQLSFFDNSIKYRDYKSSMKTSLLLVLALFIVMSFVACSKGVDTSQRDYYRANSASDKAQKELSKE